MNNHQQNATPDAMETEKAVGEHDAYVHEDIVENPAMTRRILLKMDFRSVISFEEGPLHRCLTTSQGSTSAGFALPLLVSRSNQCWQCQTL